MHVAQKVADHLADHSDSGFRPPTFSRLKRQTFIGVEIDLFK